MRVTALKGMCADLQCDAIAAMNCCEKAILESSTPEVMATGCADADVSMQMP